MIIMDIDLMREKSKSISRLDTVCFGRLHNVRTKHVTQLSAVRCEDARLQQNERSSRERVC